MIYSRTGMIDMKRHSLLGSLLGISLISGSSLAHIEQSEPLQSLRQSYFALLGMTFAPMGDMVKGKIEWDDALFMTWANDLNHAAQFGVERGFAPGTDKGTTRAKPNIWSKDVAIPKPNTQDKRMPYRVVRINSSSVAVGFIAGL